MENSNTRQKLLQAAIDEFTECGFDGARVARIAKRAGVSQALLYYNFSSKQAILDEIIEGFLQSNVEHIRSAYPINTGTTESEVLLDQGLRKSLDFILDKHKEISILLMQALVKTQDNKKVLTFFNKLNQEIRDNTLEKLGYHLDYSQGAKRKVVDYYFILIPFIMFGILGKEWCQANEVPLEEADQAMVDVVKQIYDGFLK